MIASRSGPSGRCPPMPTHGPGFYSAHRNAMTFLASSSLAVLCLPLLSQLPGRTGIHPQIDPARRLPVFSYEKLPSWRHANRHGVCGLKGVKLKWRFLLSRCLCEPSTSTRHFLLFGCNSSGTTPTPQCSTGWDGMRPASTMQGKTHLGVPRIKKQHLVAWTIHRITSQRNGPPTSKHISCLWDFPSWALLC